MMEDGDDDAAALGFVSPVSDIGFGRNAVERERPVFSRYEPQLEGMSVLHRAAVSDTSSGRHSA